MSKLTIEKTPVESTLSAGKYIGTSGAFAYIFIYVLGEFYPQIWQDPQLITAITVVLMGLTNTLGVYLNKRFTTV